MTQQRKKVLIDWGVQGKLMLLMVGLEVLILILAMFYLYGRFDSIIAHDLYSIHRNNQEGLVIAFAGQIGRVAIVLLLVNTMMLFAAHYVWSSQINSVIQGFRSVMVNIGALQFIDAAPAGKPVHELLRLQNLWYRNERNRVAALKQVTAQFCIQDQYRDEDLKILRYQINRCLHLLESPGPH